MIYVAEITVCTASDGTTQTHYFSSGLGWSTTAADTPADTFISPRLRAVGTYRREMWAGDALFGPVRSSFGSVRLANGDGGLDDWTGYAVDGRAFKLYCGDEDGAAYPADYTLVFEARMLRATFDLTGITIVLRDRLVELDRPVLQTTWGGTGDLDGDAQMAGQFQPRAYGDMFLIPPILVDGSRDIYFLCENPCSLSGIMYEAGVGLSNEAAYASTASLLSTAPTPGAVRWYIGGPTYVRFGTTPATSLQATCSAKTIDGSAASISNLAAEAGITGASAATPTIEAYIGDPKTTYLAVAAREAMARPTWFGFDRNMAWVCEQVVDPSGESPVGTITHWDMLQITRRPPDGVEVPLWKVRVRGRKNHATRSGLATSAVSATRKDWYEYEVDSDSSVQTKHPRAGELAVEAGSFIAGSADLYLDLHGIERDMLTVVAPMTSANLAYDLNQVVTVKHPRFGLSAGKKYLIVAIELDLADERIIWTLWG